jgi:hypothetical protein
VKLLRDHEGLMIRLTDERLAHILEQPETRVGDKFVCVVVKVVTDAIKKGVQIWPRES